AESPGYLAHESGTGLGQPFGQAVARCSLVMN
ncbi:MAG: hypothetical protein ACI9I4_002227, partial [Neolewinella sp.]